jgi:hypothetical protein
MGTRMFKAINNVYDHVYYRLYLLMGRLERYGDDTHVSAAILLAALQMQNIFLIFMVGLYCGLWHRVGGFRYGELMFFALGVAICILNIVAVVRDKRYIKIIKKYSDQGYILSSQIIDLTLAGSFLLMFVFAFLLDNM